MDTEEKQARTTEPGEVLPGEVLPGETELLLPEPVPSIRELDQKRYARPRGGRGNFSAEQEEDCRDLMTCSPLDKHRLCRQTSVWKAANQLFRSHLYMATGASWACAENLVVWTTFMHAEIRDHPETEKIQVERVLIDGVERRRPYDMLQLGGVKYAMSPAMNSLVFQDHPYWATIGLRFRKGHLPKLGLGKWIEVDHKETLMPDKRVPLLYLIDGEFQKRMVPAASRRMQAAIVRVFDKDFIAETFPELAGQDDSPDKEKETDGPTEDAKTNPLQ